MLTYCSFLLRDQLPNVDSKGEDTPTFYWVVITFLLLWILNARFQVLAP